MGSAALGSPQQDIPGGRPSMSHPDASRLARERAFHDQLAADLMPDRMPPQDPGALENALLDAAQLRPSMRVLDLGCGSGDLTIPLLDRGAEVTALDISPGMVHVAEQRVRAFRPRAACRFVTAPAESTALAPGSFDLVLGRYILHHLDLPLVAAELARLLAPAGRAVFLENSGRNLVLSLARDHLAGRAGIPRYGTEDERPLVEADAQALARHFGRVRLLYPVFEFLVLFDRQVLRYRYPRVGRVLRKLDQLVYERAPRLRRFSFRLLVVVEK